MKTVHMHVVISQCWNGSLLFYMNNSSSFCAERFLTATVLFKDWEISFELSFTVKYFSQLWYLDMIE